jgi:hypothetical protein
MHRRFRISGVELCDDHHTLLPVFLIALPTVLGHCSACCFLAICTKSLKGPAGGPDTNPSTSATNGCKLNGPRGGVNAWRPSSQAIRVVPMAAISSSIAQTEESPPRARDSRAALRSRARRREIADEVIE